MSTDLNEIYSPGNDAGVNVLCHTLNLRTRSNLFIGTRRKTVRSDMKNII